MANPLTGDFEAVLQVSGRTVDRLLACMHEADGSATNRPTFPHRASLVIDDSAGMRGRVWAQVSTPRLHLLDRVQDRVGIEFDLRARYVPDPGSEALPEFINGSVQAQYRIDPVDNCPGYTTGDYLWFRVIASSVSFDGSVLDDDATPFLAMSAVQQVAVKRVTQLIATLLKTKFAAPPEPVDRRFRRGAMRSLSAGPGASAVALPLALSGGEPVGAITSIWQLVTSGADIAIAVNRDTIMGQAQALADAVGGFTASWSVSSTTRSPEILGQSIDFTVSTTYNLTVGTPLLSWQPAPDRSAATINLKAHGSIMPTTLGWPAVGFDIDVDAVLWFDAGGSGLTLSPGKRNVKVTAVGPFSGQVADSAAKTISDMVKGEVDALCSTASQALQTATSTAANALAKQIGRLVGQVSVGFDGAEFLADGLVVRGTVSLPPRRAPVVMFDKVYDASDRARDGFSAWQAWVPGGRIDRFDWSWSWFNATDPPGAETDDDRFVLRRPEKSSSGQASEFVDARVPLPGLDGMGTVCLALQGSRIDPVTGVLVPVQAVRRCTSFGFRLRTVIDRPGRLHLRELHEREEVALIDVVPAPGELRTPNTLIVRSGRELDHAIVGVLSAGLDVLGRRDDAGLLVLVLVDDGRLAHVDPETVRALRDAGARHGAAVLVNEDVDGAWSEAFPLQRTGGGAVWCLVGPTGGLPWRHEGELEPDALEGALDSYLLPSPAAVARTVRPLVDIGFVIPPLWHFPDLREPRCPPITFRFPKAVKSTITFLRPGSASAGRTLERLARARPADDDGLTAVVLTGDGQQRVHGDLGGVITLADPGGDLAARFGIRTWPTTVTVNEDAVVTAIETGASHREELL